MIWGRGQIMVTSKGVKQGLILLLLVLFIASLYLNFLYYQSERNKGTHISIFVTDFYYEVNQSVLTLETLINTEPTGNELYIQLDSLIRHLNTLDHMLRRTPYYMGGITGGANDISVVAGIINSGTTHQEKYIPPFRADNQLDQSEIAFLKAFKEYMDNLRLAFQAPETDQLAQDITRDKYNMIISNHVQMEVLYPSFLDEYMRYR